jgi:HSP20 family protein
MTKQELTRPAGTELRPFAFQWPAFTTLQREIDRLFDDFGRGFERVAPVATPKIDIGETDGEFEITAELPGMEEKDVNVHFADGVLTLSGEKTVEAERKEKAYAVNERTYGAFTRTIPLPAGIDPAAIKASMSKGVLKVIAPKPASAKASKIEVKAG